MFALIHTPRPKRRIGNFRARAPRYNCGSHGKLTCEEIQRLSGITRSGVLRRIKAGTVGEALVAPKLGEIRASTTKRPAMVLAYRLATLYPNRVPTLAEIQSVRPMTKKNAYRWQDTARRALEASR